MELALNLVWVAIAALIAIAGGARALSLSERRQCFIAITALVCLAVLLFPVISMSDDLDGSHLYVPGGKFKSATSGVRAIHAVPVSPVAVTRVLRTSWRKPNCKSNGFLVFQGFTSSNLERRPPPHLA